MGEKANRLKKNESKETNDSDPVKKKSKKSAEQKEGIFQRARDFLNDERTLKVAGLFCLLVSAYLLIAFISYIFTWQDDQDKVFRFSLGALFKSDVIVQNKLGRLGAFISHVLIYNAYGICSFLLIPLFFVTGINWVLQHRIFNLRVIYKNIFFLLFTVSPAMGFLFQSSPFPYGGAFGNFVSHWLTEVIGIAGTSALLLFVFIAYSVILFNYNFHLPSFNFRKSKAVNETEEKTPAASTLEEEKHILYDGTLLLPQVKSNGEEAQMELKEKDLEKGNIIIAKNVDPANNLRNKILANDVELEVENAAAADEKATEIKAPKIPKGSVGTPFDPTQELSRYIFPELSLLEQYGSEKIRIDEDELQKNKNQIVQTLSNYGIGIEKIKATVGPTVTLYEIVPKAGVRISKIKNLEDDIALNLAALGIRIIAPIPGKGTIGIEVPNLHKEVVSMRTMLGSEKFQHTDMDLPILLGKTISNEIFMADLAKMPHLLVAGATGQGKSVGINALLVSLLYKKHPSQIKFVLVDPKKVELSLYQQIEKHFLAKLPNDEDPIIVDTSKVINTLKALGIEMDMRYDLLKAAQVRNIKEYNEKFLARKLNPQNGHKFLPYIILIIDEFADLIMTAGKEIEMPIARLAQLARAIGIHLIIATQRPSVNIITGTIKANFPARIAFKVASKVDSRTILDAGGAEQLIGRGDMLLSLNGDIIRLQCPFVDTPEVEKVVEFIGDQPGYPTAMLLPEVPDEEGAGNDSFDPDERDELFEEAAQIIVQFQQGSTSLLQRRLKLGYNRAGRLMDQMEAAGIVGPNQGSKVRDVLIKDPMQLEQFLSNMKALN